MSTSSSRLDLNLDANGDADTLPAWKHELNERLQATRTRHSHKAAEGASLSTLEQLSKAESRAAQLAAKVAARYANAPSYSDILAAEARAEAEAAEAAVSAAQNTAAAAQARLDRPEPPKEALAAGEEESFSANINQADQEGQYSSGVLPSVLDSGNGTIDPGAGSLEDAMISPAQPLPVNLIEFPRELVAARKARPRLAEGPLRETSGQTAHDQPQLRIFEVESESISKTVKIEALPSERSSIRLDAKPAFLRADEGPSALELPLKSAPLEDRIMAGIFDAALVLLAFVLFVLVFAACTAHPPSGKPALISSGLVLAGLFLLYQYLFFRFTEGTPGMHYAKIALCTFEDENPTRKAMRRRILFAALSAAPLGLGFAWAWFDADRLGWHDRLSRMYQRSYR